MDINKNEQLNNENKHAINQTPAQQIEQAQVDNDVNAQTETAAEQINAELERTLPNDEGFIPPNKKPTNKKGKIIKIVCTILFIAVIIGSIAGTAIGDFTRDEKIDFGLVGESFRKHWFCIPILVTLFSLTLLIEALKIALMLYKTTGKFRYLKSLTCATIGKYYDYVTPLGAGGQPFQIYYLNKHNVPGGPAGAIPIASFFLNQFSFFVLAIVAFILNTPIVPQGVKIAAYFGSVMYILVPLFLIVFSFLPRAGHKVISFGVGILSKLKICKDKEAWIKKGNDAIDNNKKNMSILTHSKTVTIFCSFLSLLISLCLNSMPYFVLLLFGGNATLSWGSWLEITCITYFIYAAITFIPTPGNSGAADGSFYLIFNNMLSAGFCFIGMMTWRIFSFYMYLIIGFFVTITVSIRNHRRMKRLKLGQQLENNTANN